jgi:hypothetical protein
VVNQSPTFCMTERVEFAALMALWLGGMAYFIWDTLRACME